MEVCTIGGYEEVGKNMTAVKVGEDVIIFDSGVYLPALIDLQEQEQEELKSSYDEESLRKIKAIPDDTVLDEKGWRDKVRAIVISHAHLDHVGAVPYLAYRYPQAEIIGTPFTIEVLKTLAEESSVRMKNKKTKVNPDSTITIKGKSDKIKIEFIRANHSTPQTCFVVWHSKEGKFFYSLDFKFDKHPTMGKPPNFKRLKEIGKKGVECFLADALYSDSERRTSSERIARYLLEDVMSNVRGKDNAFFITTFSSHISRLKSIVDFAQKTNREIVFLGRSLNKYVKCAINTNLCPFKGKIKLLKYGNQVKSFLKKLEKDRGKYLVVCTGHQGENGSILDRIAKGETPFRFRNGDTVIFSSKTIPVPQNLNAREKLDKRLKKDGVRIQSDVHVSGHAGREDLRDMIQMIKPKNIIPAHGSLQKEVEMIELSGEMGYKLHENSYLSSNGKTIKL